MSMTQIAPRVYLRTAPGGSQSYIYRVTLGGFVIQRGLGSATGVGRAKVTAAQAIKKGLLLDAELAQGHNPFLKSGKQQTFGQVWTAHVAIASKKWAKDTKGECGTAKQWQTWLLNDLKEIAGMRFDHPALVDTVELVLARVWGSKKGEDIRTAMFSTFRRASVKGCWHGANPCERERIVVLLGEGRDGRGKDQGGDVEHHAMMAYADIPALLATLAAQKGMAATALRFLVLTTARSSNVRFACKANIDRQARTWTIPAEGQRGERMKSGVEHVYYLNDQAMEIVNALWDQPGDYLFAGKNGVLGSTALDDKLCDPKAKGGLGLRGVATVHGMRASFGTWAKRETQFADIADAMLAHAEGKVRSAYQRGDAPAKMTAVSQLWGNQCAGIVRPVMLQLAA